MESQNEEKVKFIKEKIQKNFKPWQDVSFNQIDVKKLCGLTNEIYRVQIQNDQSKVVPQTILFRIFGSVEGLVDKKREQQVFQILGEKGVGPACLYYGEKFRIEEYLSAGIHPDHQLLRNKIFRRLFAKYLCNFHQSGLTEALSTPQDQPIIKNLLDNKNFAAFDQKIQRKELFNENELNMLKIIQNASSQDEIDKLKAILPKSNRTCFCHNDLNNLNLFYTNIPYKKILYIDFEYCQFNYVAYDIANFMNECSINYGFEGFPYFELKEEYEFSNLEILEFASYYILCSEVKDQQIRNLIEDEIISNENLDINNLIKKYIKNIDQFELSVKELAYEIKCCRVLCNWYWTIWSVVTSKPEVIMNFGHIEHGIMRYNYYHKLWDKIKNEYIINQDVQ